MINDDILFLEQGDLHQSLFPAAPYGVDISRIFTFTRTRIIVLSASLPALKCMLNN